MDQTPHKNLSGKSALLLINPKARQGAEAIERAKESLTRRGFEVIAPDFESPGDFSRIICAHANEVDLVVVGGGDGSVRSAISGLLETKITLGIIPLGTANNFARNLGIVGDVELACDVLTNGEERLVDVAVVNNFYFLNVAGLGLSTEVNTTVDHNFKRRFGVLAYIITAFKTWKNSRAHRVWITYDGTKKKIRTHQLTICNGRFFGNGITIAPDAAIDDGRLDLVSVKAESFLQGLGLALSLWRARGERRKGLIRISAREMVIRTARSRNIDTDGEILTQTPAHFKVHRSALKVLAPRLETDKN